MKKKESMEVFIPSMLIIIIFGTFLFSVNAKVNEYEIGNETELESPATRMNQDQKEMTKQKAEQKISDPINDDLKKAVNAADETKDMVVK